MERLKDSMIAFLTHDEIQEMVKRLGKEIEMDYHGKELIFICPLKGSVLFMADLIRNITLPSRVDFVHATAVERKGAIRMNKDISVNITGKHVIVVEEIIDTGRT
ncbi:MAG TPA: phosphoribosyltransferase family protein, partial [Bdellovibrionales bacterium]|nr:phosphoribosyltransferase family protein [Bdellovibrionales bacterium]